MMVRTRVRFARLISARTWDCFARLMTDFLRFFTFTVAPCAIQLSCLGWIDGTTLSEAHLFVNERRQEVVTQFGSGKDEKLPAPKAGGLYKTHDTNEDGFFPN
jgi:hypothetical protein